MRRFLLVAPLLLAACGTLGPTPYDPTPNIYDVTPATQQTVNDDITDCAKFAANYKRPFSVSGAVTTAGSGAAGNLSAAATPKAALGGLLGPILGGVGGLVQAFAQWVGLIDTDRPLAEKQCLFQRFSKDHAGTLVEPPL